MTEETIDKTTSDTGSSTAVADQSEQTDDLLGESGESETAGTGSTADTSTPSSEVNPILQDAMRNTGDPSAAVGVATEPKKRGRPSKAEKAAKAEADKPAGTDNPAGTDLKPIKAMNQPSNLQPPKPAAANRSRSTSSADPSDPFTPIAAAVSEFAAAHPDASWVIGILSEWLPQVAYRKVFHQIGQQHGEAGIYHSLQIMCDHLAKSGAGRLKRNGMAMAASMQVGSVRHDANRKIDIGGVELMPVRDVANRFAGLGMVESVEYARES
jgi:hypothetical protein